MREQDRARVTSDRRGRADRGHDMATRPQVDPRRQPRQWVGDRVRDGEPGELECQAGEAVGSGRARGRDEGSHTRFGSGGEDGTDAAHGVTGDRPHGHLRLLDESAKRSERVGAELAGGEWQVLGRVGAVAADVEGQAVEARGVEEQRDRQRSIARRFPAVDQHHAGSGRATRRPPQHGRDPGYRETLSVLANPGIRRCGFLGDRSEGFGKRI